MFTATPTYSGTFNFAPTNAEVILNAFDRIGIRPTEVTATQTQRAIMEFNLLLTKLDNQGVNLWTVDLQNVALVQGTATYNVPDETINILDVFIRYGSPAIDRILTSMSRTEYASQTVKTTQAFPTQYWFDRLIAPTITLYPTPDGNGPYTLYYYRFRQIQDSTLPNAVNPEVPVRWLDALVAGLAHRLARIYAPTMEAQRKMDADEAWRIAATEDVEYVPLYITPSFGGYFR